MFDMASEATHDPSPLVSISFLLNSYRGHIKSDRSQPHTPQNPKLQSIRPMKRNYVPRNNKGEVYHCSFYTRHPGCGRRILQVALKSEDSYSST